MFIAGTPQTIPKEQTLTKGRYWSLPQDQCAICAENASLNMDLSQPSNAFSYQIPPASVSADHIESELPAFPIYNPYVANCGHIYCYHCVAERMMQASDAAEDDGRWECLRCRTSVSNAERYTVELESDVSGSDDGFSSDISISGSMGSYRYSESGWSESSSQ